MKKLTAIIIGLLISINIFSQEDRYKQAFDIYERYSDSLKINLIATYSFIDEKIDSYKSYPFSINEYNITKDYNSYTFHLSFNNRTDKVIKYITVTVVPYNSVDDISGETEILRGVGPIENERSSSYSWDLLWYRDVVNYVKISSIKLEFTDGTTRTIYSKEIDKILVNPVYTSVKVGRRYLGDKYTKFLSELNSELISIGFGKNYINTLRDLYKEKHESDVFESTFEFIELLDKMLE